MFDGRDVSKTGIASFHVANLSEKIHYDVTKAVVGKIFYSKAEVPPHPAHILQLLHLSDLKFLLVSDPGDPNPPNPANPGDLND